MPKSATTARKSKGPAFGTPEWRKKHGLPVAGKKSAGRAGSKAGTSKPKTKSAGRAGTKAGTSKRQTLAQRVEALERAARK